jgi:hypothetical protein
MLSKCVNPSCQATFRYLHEGKLFKLEGSDPRFKTLGIKPVNSEYFWLCSDCAVQMTVVFQNGQVLVQPPPKNGCDPRFGNGWERAAYASPGSLLVGFLSRRITHILRK